MVTRWLHDFVPLAIKLQRSCSFTGMVNVVFVRPTSTRVVEGKRLMRIKTILKKVKRGDVVSIGRIDGEYLRERGDFRQRMPNS
jgi:hypothetical protein